MHVQIIMHVQIMLLFVSTTTRKHTKIKCAFTRLYLQISSITVITIGPMEALPSVAEQEYFPNFSLLSRMMVKTVLLSSCN